MDANVAHLREQAMTLVAAGNLSRAIEILHQLAEETGDPEDRMLLGKMAYLATDVTQARHQLERAYRDFQARGEPRKAALAATALGRVHLDMLDDKVVGRAWLVRANRLLENDDCVEKGYVIVGLFGASVESAEELQASARAALDLAYRFQDRDLECKALGDSGMALVSMGHVKEGMALLDEAVTMIVGGDCRDAGVIGTVFCGLISACDRCGDAARAEAWLRQIEDRMPSSEDGPAIHLYAHCWTALGSVLCHVGRWQEAEKALRMGIAKGERSYIYVKHTARAALADLWIRQGRLEEAAHLIDQKTDRVDVMGPRARLHLARGEFDLAGTIARSALRRLVVEDLRAASLLLVIVEAALGSGNVAEADEAASRLQRAGESSEVSAVGAYAALALGKVAVAHGDLELAAHHLETGLTVAADCPPLRAALHLELAKVYANRTDAETIVNAEAAMHIYRELGSPQAEIAAEMLRALGRSVPDALPVQTPLDVLSPREREVLELLALGLSNPEIGKRLFITAKTAEHHVSSILSKLGLRSRTEAATFAVSYNISRETASTS